MKTITTMCALALLSIVSVANAQSVTLSAAGFLEITGTSSADTIEVGHYTLFSFHFVEVTINGTDYYPNDPNTGSGALASTVELIDIYGEGGDDDIYTTDLLASIYTGMDDSTAATEDDCPIWITGNGGADNVAGSIDFSEYFEDYSTAQGDYSGWGIDFN